MSRRNVLLNPMVVIPFYIAVNVALWSLGWVLGDGWMYIDRSPHRDLLYSVLHLYLPAAAIVGLVHSAATITHEKDFAASIACAILGGIAGCALMITAIEKSSDPVAKMAYIGLIAVSAIFFLMSFVITAVILSIRRYLKYRSPVEK